MTEYQVDFPGVSTRVLVDIQEEMREGRVFKVNGVIALFLITKVIQSRPRKQIVFYGPVDNAYGLLQAVREHNEQTT